MDKSISSDFVGRIRNISLAPSPANSLVPLLEAITNSIHAIEERFGTQDVTAGKIEIEILRSDEPENPIVGFEIRDNGAGLNKDNLKSFETSDSRHKLKKGGKGVGRFMWLKVFEKAHVQSRFGKEPTDALSFEFRLDEESQLRGIKYQTSLPELGRTVRLIPFRQGYQAMCPKKISTIESKIISHFLHYFINLNAPKIYLIDEKTHDLFNTFSGYVENDNETNFSVANEDDSKVDFQLNSFLVPKNISDDEKGINAIFYGANGRSVFRKAIDNAIGLKAIDGRYAYFGFVSSEYLDQHVNQERTDFSWSDNFKDEVNKKAIEIARLRTH